MTHSVSYVAGRTTSTVMAANFSHVLGNKPNHKHNKIHIPDRRSVVVNTAKPNLKRRQEQIELSDPELREAKLEAERLKENQWGIVEEEEAVDEEDDFPIWITTPWTPGVLGGGWWDPYDADTIPQPEPWFDEPSPDPWMDEGMPMTQEEKECIEWKENHKVEQQKEFDELRSKVGRYDVPVAQDIRLKYKRGEREEWTHEEILDFIGEPSYEMLTTFYAPVLADYQQLCPSYPSTHDWMELRGLIKDDSEVDDDHDINPENLLQDEFADFDSTKVTDMDMEAIDIGDEEEDDASA